MQIVLMKLIDCGNSIFSLSLALPDWLREGASSGDKPEHRPVADDHCGQPRPPSHREWKSNQFTWTSSL